MAPKRSRSRHARPKRIPRWARIALTGLLLGLVVVAAGALMNRPSALLPSTPTSTGSTEPTATNSATSSPTPSAVPTATASATTTTDPGSTDSGDSATFAEDAYTRPVAPLASLLPRSVAGYKVGNVESSPASAIVPLEPTGAGPLGKATIVVLTVFDKKSAAGARAYVDSFQRAYPKDLDAVTIGTMSGRFGTDGLHLAAITFSRGRYAFEVVLTTTRDAPRDLKSVTLQAAEAFGATKTAP